MLDCIFFSTKIIVFSFEQNQLLLILKQFEI